MTPAPDVPSIPDFELLRAIGRGSYGEVWLARSVTGVFRVIKIVRRDRFDDDRPYLRELEGITRFQVAASGRPRQLALLHVGRNDPERYFYYVMEPADDAESGSAIDPARYTPLTLKELFARRGRLPASECVQLALELARGLAVLHAANLIHRDIKPSNIIFVQRVPKLADVGLVADSEATMTCAGTPGYAPREGAGTVAADIFSLGKVLYEIATGLDRMEFPRLPQELADATDVPLLREINAIILRTCDPDPSRRHPSAEALVRDLELVQAGRSVAFYEALRRRTRVIAAAAAALTFAAALVAALLFWRAGILQRANERARHALYRSDLAVAQLARASGDLGRARAALARQIPQPGETDLRGLEWAILAHSVRGDGLPLEPATNGVAVTQIAVDPSSRWVAAAFADHSAALWDLRTGRIARRFLHIGFVGGFTSPSRLIAGTTDSEIREYSIPELTFTSIATNLTLQKLLPNNQILVTSPRSDTTVFILEPKTQSITETHDISALVQPNHPVAISLSDDLRYLFVGTFRESGITRERTIGSYDFQTTNLLWSSTVSERILWSIPSPDNHHVLVNVGGLTPKLYSFASESPPTPLVGHTARVQAAAFSPRGEKIATAGSDQSIRIWSTSRGESLRILRGLARPVDSLAWFPDGTHVIAGDDSGSIRVFAIQDSETPEVSSGYHADVHGDLVYSFDSHRLAISKATNRVSIIRTDDLAVIREIRDVFQPISFSADGNRLFALSSDLRVKSVDLQSPPIPHQSLFSFPEGFSIRGWALSQNGKVYAVTGGNGELLIIDLETGAALQGSHPNKDEMFAISFVPDGTEVWASASDGTIHRWRTETASYIGIETETEGDLQSIGVSPDNRWLAVSVVDDSSIRIWDRGNRKWNSRLWSHRRFVTALHFADNGRRMISAGADGRVIIWRVPEFEELSAFELGTATSPTGDEGIAVLKVAPDGSALAALTEDGRVRVWQTR